jgi:hypothetical protein
VIQRILGHAQVTTTRIYTEPTDPLTREAAGLIGKALWPDAGKLQPQLQPEAGSKKRRQKAQFNGCAARDLNPEPAD